MYDKSRIRFVGSNASVTSLSVLWRLRWRLALMAVVCIVAATRFVDHAAADGESFSACSAPPKNPDDPASPTLDDLDHPADFCPRLRQQGIGRNGRGVRQQVRVAEGLWPMPVKTPLNAVIHGRIDRDEYTDGEGLFLSTHGALCQRNLYRPKRRRPGEHAREFSVHMGIGRRGGSCGLPIRNAKIRSQTERRQTMEGARSPLQALRDAGADGLHGLSL